MPEPLFRSLDVLPRHSYSFLWADYVELLCLCSKNDIVAKGNLQAQLQEAEDLQTDAGQDELNSIEDDSSTNDDNVDPNEREVLDDRITRRWEDIKKRLHARSLTFPGWPFELNGDVLRAKFDAQNPEQKLYVSLLIASSLRLCHDTRSPEVTSAFEEISYHWLRQSLTGLWQVRPFGAHQTLPNAYVGTLRAKLEALAEDISGVLVKQATDYESRNTGDGGIDLVAWQDMGDKRGNMLIIFGQCACSPTDWESKQLDVTPSSTEAHIHSQHPGSAYCFVPHDLSMNDRSWERSAHVKRTVIVDRRRLLNLFKVLKTWEQLPSWPFVLEATQQSAELAT